MSVMTLSSLYKTGEYVSSDMFGANIVFATSDSGVPTPDFTEAVDAFGIQNIRFGGGQADVDPDKANSAGELPIDGINSINIVTMRDGALRPELVNFLEWCEASSALGNPTKATLIIPTKHLDIIDFPMFVEEVEAFVTTVMQQYGDTIAAFQIGNEYWEMGETAYGIKASLGTEAAQRGMIAAGYTDENQPDILVQMGTAGNEGSEFPATPGVSDFVARNEAANDQIILQLSDNARDAIDGVTEHYYYNATDYAFDETDAGVKNIGRDYDIWADELGDDLDLHITEWNVKTTATEQHGMVAGSSMVKLFENMIDLGTDGAHVWALDYHSRTALTLESDDGINFDSEGRVTNSAQGAVFDLMSGSLVGKELVSSSFLTGIPGIEVSSYASAEELVFYISSRSLEVSEVTLDLASETGISGPATAVQIAMDPSSSNGLQWERGEAAESVLIDGEPYFYNEHDVDVILTDLVFADSSEIELELKPFEVVELKVALGTPLSNDKDPISKPIDPIVVDPEPVDPTPVDPEPKPEPAPFPLDHLGTPVTSEKHYFLGDEGNDVLLWSENVVYVDTGGGLDTVIVDALRDEASFKFDGFGKPVLTTPNSTTELTLANVERIAFNDGMLALDEDGNCGQAYRLYQASFDREPDTDGLAFWMHQLDCGAISLVEAAELFLASAEFAQTYGDNDALADSEFIDLLYENVLNRSPDAEGYDFWQDQAEKDVSRKEMLVSFSESAENKANVAPVFDDGIWFS